MKKISLLTGFVLALVVVTLAGIPQVNVFASAQPRPYKSVGPEIVVQEAPHPDCGPGRLKVDIVGSGQAAHMGAYTITRRHCFNLATAAIEDGYFEQTAANGDKVWGAYAGQMAGVLEFAEDGSPLVVKIHSTWTINGGTGRFADAEGAGTAVGVFNLAAEQGSFDMDGWITYAAGE